MQQETGTIDKSGRVLIPAAMRKSMGLAPGDEIRLDLEGDRLILETKMAGLRRARKLAAQKPGQKESAAESVRAMRDEEFRLEENKLKRLSDA